MSSVIGQSYRQVPPNSLYTNLLNCASTIFDSNGVPAPWLSAPAASGLQTVGTAVLRDMGRIVYLPNPNVATAAGGQSTILRRVQLLPTGTSGYYGTGDIGTAVAGSDTDFYCGYIKLGGQTFGGGGAYGGATYAVANLPGFVRLN